MSNKRAAHTAQGERATEIERERDLLEEEEGDEQAKELTTEVMSKPKSSPLKR